MVALAVPTFWLAAVRTPVHAASRLLGVEYPVEANLFEFNTLNGAVSIVGPTGKTNVVDMTSDTRTGPATIWGIRTEPNHLLTLDPNTGGTLSDIPITGILDPIVSIAFDPVTGVLYGNTSQSFGASADALYTISPATGAATLLGPIGFVNVYALGFSQTGKLYGIADDTDEFIGLNTTTGAGNLIAALTSGLYFDLASRPEDDVMYVSESDSSRLFTIDRTTGALTLVGGFGSSPNIAGLAFTEVPEASHAALIAIPALLGWRILRRSRTRVCEG